MPKINSRWLRHLKTTEEKESFKNQLLGNPQIFEVLENILKDEEEQSLKDMREDTSFDSPAWSEKQAYNLGVQHLANKLKQLIPDRGEE